MTIPHTIMCKDPEALAVELGDGKFTLKGKGVFYPFDQFQYVVDHVEKDRVVVRIVA